MSLGGLKTMNSECKEVRDVLKELARKIHTSNAVLTSNELGTHSLTHSPNHLLTHSPNHLLTHSGIALYGMMYMSSEYKEVRDVLKGLTTKIQTCRMELSGTHSLT
jgi:hypothetical protein